MIDLYSHPLASFCHKVLIALYESGTAFNAVMVDLGNPGDHARFLDLWPVGKLPVLRDTLRDQTIPEATIIIEYLDQHYPGERPMLPAAPAARLDARLWDRFFDLYVQDPMQKIVFDSFRPDGQHDAAGVAEARDRLELAYGMVERHMAGKIWAAGADFSIADCAAAPALFFARTLVPFHTDQPNLDAYFERLIARPSVNRVLVEAQPFFDYFPFRDAIPARFRTLPIH